MGAFLRCLGECDSRYDQPAMMRRLRRRVADEFASAVAELCLGSTPAAPCRIHLCLLCTSAESIQNHNCFIEAAAEKAKTTPGIRNVLQLRRNVDSLQLAQELASSTKQTLKVGLLNGANRKLFGNHWFQSGARQAIDENLHRRSSSMARAALMLNFDTQPRPRTDTELLTTLSFYKQLRTDEFSVPVITDKTKGKQATKQAYVAHTPGAVTGSTSGANSSSSRATGEVKPSGADASPPKSDLLAGASGSKATQPTASAQQKGAWPVQQEKKKSGWCPCGKRKPSTAAVSPVQDSPAGGQQRQGQPAQGQPPVVNSSNCGCCGSGGKTKGPKQTGAGGAGAAAPSLQTAAPRHMA